MARLIAKTMIGDKIFELMGSIVRRYIQNATDNTVSDIGKALEITTLGALNLYLLRRCGYSFVLEILAD